MSTLSREQVADALYQAGFRGQDLINMVAIAGRESAYKPAAHRTDSDPSRLTGDLGLFQINIGANWNTVKSALGLTDRRQLFDPIINAKAAKVLFDRAGGYFPWRIGPDGWDANGRWDRNVNLGAAQAAVERYNANPSAYSAAGAAAGSSDSPSAGSGRSQGEWPEWRDVEPEPRDDIPNYEPPTPDPHLQAGLTSLLESFGINYPSAPRATPQLLAFMRGLGVQMDQAEDNYDTRMESLRRARGDAFGDLRVSDERRRSAMTSDAQSRGALSSGATNTAFAEHAEDVDRRGYDIDNAYAEGADNALSAWETARTGFRQRALERVLDEDTNQQTDDARRQAEIDAIRRAQEEEDRRWRREQEAERRRYERQRDFYESQGR